MKDKQYRELKLSVLKNISDNKYTTLKSIREEDAINALKEHRKKELENHFKQF